MCHVTISVQRKLWTWFLWLNIVESLEFIVAQLLWHSWVALLYEFKFSTKTNTETVIFLTKKKTPHIHEISSPQINETSKSVKICPTNSIDFTIKLNQVRAVNYFRHNKHFTFHIFAKLAFSFNVNYLVISKKRPKVPEFEWDQVWTL